MSEPSEENESPPIKAQGVELRQNTNGSKIEFIKGTLLGMLIGSMASVAVAVILLGSVFFATSWFAKDLIAGKVHYKITTSTDIYKFIQQTRKSSDDNKNNLMTKGFALILASFDPAKIQPDKIEKSHVSVAFDCKGSKSNASGNFDFAPCE